ncbi:MAG: hypothetical protein QM726_05615 [Chitinophagaceae bacterium]
MRQFYKPAITRFDCFFATKAVFAAATGIAGQPAAETLAGAEVCDATMLN